MRLIPPWKAAWRGGIGWGRISSKSMSGANCRIVASRLGGVHDLFDHDH
jgi:hypothetical protein